MRKGREGPRGDGENYAAVVNNRNRGASLQHLKIKPGVLGRPCGSRRSHCAELETRGLESSSAVRCRDPPGRAGVRGTGWRCRVPNAHGTSTEMVGKGWLSPCVARRCWDLAALGWQFGQCSTSHPAAWLRESVLWPQDAPTREVTGAFPSQRQAGGRCSVARSQSGELSEGPHARRLDNPRSRLDHLQGLFHTLGGRTSHLLSPRPARQGSCLRHPPVLLHRLSHRCCRRSCSLCWVLGVSVHLGPCGGCALSVPTLAEHRCVLHPV